LHYYCATAMWCFIFFFHFSHVALKMRNQPQEDLAKSGYKTN